MTLGSSIGHCPTQDGVAVMPSDGSLLGRFQGGSQDAATMLFNRYARRLLTLARSRCSTGLLQRVDADDIVQSVFRTFFGGAKKGQYVVPDGGDLWKLLAVIALNKVRTAATRHRAGKRNVKATVELTLLDAATEATRSPEAEQAFLRLDIGEALERLTATERKMIELRMEEFEVAEIAAKCGCSKRSTERLLGQARDKLKRIFEEGGSR